MVIDRLVGYLIKKCTKNDASVQEFTMYVTLLS